jgi:hypothetical protein
MRAYSSMPTSEFIAQLRTIAINAGARPLVIDQLDAIVDAPTEDEIVERTENAYASGEVDGARDAWKDCYTRLEERLGGIIEPGEEFNAILQLLMDIKP